MPPHTTTPLSPFQAGRQVLHHAILSDGSLATVVTDVGMTSKWARVHASHGGILVPSRSFHQDCLAKILVRHECSREEGPAFSLETSSPLLGRFADGRWLVVESNTRSDMNARVLSPDGTLLSRFMLGDGIGHVAIDGMDRIWVGWHDEGISRVHRNMSGMWRPPSSNGVACFAPDGSIVDVPTWPTQAGLIADCYALTSTSSGAWATPYTDFPLVRFAPGKPTKWWRNELAGVTAIAVDGNHMLLAGGYGPDAARLALIELDHEGNGHAAVPLATWQMTMSAEHQERPTLLIGCGDTLHLIEGERWHRWQVGDAVTALARPSDRSPGAASATDAFR